MFCLKSLLFLNHCLDTIIHVFDKLNFTSAKSSLVRNVVDVIVCLSMLSMSTSDLHIVLICNSLEISFPLTE